MKTKNALLKIGFFVLLLTAMLFVNCTKDEITMEDLNKEEVGIPGNGAMYLANAKSILDLSNVFIEGFMISGQEMRPVHLNATTAGATVPGNPKPKATQCDYITVELRNSTEPYAVAFTAEQVMLSTEGTAAAEFPSEAIGNQYYIVIKGRNSIETWSATPQLADHKFLYDFHQAADAYGSNMKMVFGVPAIFSGNFAPPPDENSWVGLEEFVLLEADFVNHTQGYLLSDLDGNGFTDYADYTIWASNYSDLVDAVVP